MLQYSVIIQAGPEEILAVEKASELNIQNILDHQSISQVIVALPEISDSEEARQQVESWGIPCYVGDPYNVCKRILEAQKLLDEQDFSVRMLAIWGHADLDFVDTQVEVMRNNEYDLVIAPRDYDFTMAADVASITAIARIAELPEENAQIKRARFNPWGYMECHPDDFAVCHVEPAPKYSDNKIEHILSERRNHPEREFFGADYQGSRYHNMIPDFPEDKFVLDMACGSGFGSELLSRQSKLVLGVDYDPAAIAENRHRYQGVKNLQFEVGDAQVFVYQDGEYFDCVVSFHTLEHVADDKAMMECIYNNLKPGGLAVIEVPLLAKRPLGKPINPYHLREYEMQQFLDMFAADKFEITQISGVCRGMYVAKELARDAVQIRAQKIA